MWNEFLNASISQNKFQNTPLIILGNKNSGKRSLIDSLFDVSKTTIHNKRLSAQVDANKMKLKGITTAIDYAYLNVIDLTDIDYRTHTKLEIYMVEQAQHTQIYSQLANKQLLKKAVVVVMLDFTNPWNFKTELNKWVHFIIELQKKAELTISQLEQMSAKLENRYKTFKEPEFDQNGKLKKLFNFEKSDQTIEIPIPDGVLNKNIRLPLILCVNKCDLQSQVFRQQSTQKITFVLYHLRKFCVQYGASLIYTSIKNNSNLNLFYQYTLSLVYGFPFRFKSQAINEQAIFIPLGYDNQNLINDSILKLDVSKPYQDIIACPSIKRGNKQQITVQQQSKYFQKYINTSTISSSTTLAQSTSSVGSSLVDKSISQQTKKTPDATNFFKNLLTAGGSRRDPTSKITDAEKYLEKHTKQVIKKQQ